MSSAAALALPVPAAATADGEVAGEPAATPDDTPASAVRVLTCRTATPTAGQDVHLDVHVPPGDRPRGVTATVTTPRGATISCFVEWVPTATPRFTAAFQSVEAGEHCVTVCVDGHPLAPALPLQLLPGTLCAAASPLTVPRTTVRVNESVQATLIPRDAFHNVLLPAQITAAYESMTVELARGMRRTQLHSAAGRAAPGQMMWTAAVETVGEWRLEAHVHFTRNIWPVVLVTATSVDTAKPAGNLCGRMCMAASVPAVLCGACSHKVAMLCLVCHSRTLPATARAGVSCLFCSPGFMRRCVSCNAPVLPNVPQAPALVCQRCSGPSTVPKCVMPKK